MTTRSSICLEVRGQRRGPLWVQKSGCSEQQTHTPAPRKAGREYKSPRIQPPTLNTYCMDYGGTAGGTGKDLTAEKPPPLDWK